MRHHGGEPVSRWGGGSTDLSVAPSVEIDLPIGAEPALNATHGSDGATVFCMVTDLICPDPRCRTPERPAPTRRCAHACVRSPLRVCTAGASAASCCSRTALAGPLRVMKAAFFRSAHQRVEPPGLIAGEVGQVLDVVDVARGGRASAIAAADSKEVGSKSVTRASSATCCGRIVSKYS